MRKNERKYKKEEDSTCVLPSVHQPKTPFRLEIFNVRKTPVYPEQQSFLHQYRVVAQLIS